MGSGTTGIVALKLNGQFIGIEINSARFETARFNLLTNQPSNQLQQTSYNELIES